MPDSENTSEFRAFRNAALIVWVLFTLTFIGLIVRSVAQDLFGSAAPHGLETGRPTLALCMDELESLHRDLESHLATPLPSTERNWDRFEADWDGFTRRFEDRLRRVQERCVDNAPEGVTTPAVRQAMAECVDRLDNLRQHVARCGLEGEQERESVVEALADLRTAAGMHR